MTIQYHDLRSFIELVKEAGEYVEIEDADWDLEIGALTEASSEFLADPPMLMFDKVKGHMAGYRVASLTVGSRKRAAIAMGFPLDKTKLELVRLHSRKIKGVEPMAPKVVPDGPACQKYDKEAHNNA
jgi:UbiD family decarboxylase